MKVVFLQDDFPPMSFGGAGISTYELALGMKKAGNEVFVITTCRNQADAGEMEYEGLRVFKIQSNYEATWRSYVSLYNPPVVRQVETILRHIAPDVVHVNNVHFYLSYRCIKIAKKYAHAVVFTARDVMAFNYAKLDTKRYLENFDCRTTWRDHLEQAQKRWNPFRNFCIRQYLKYAGARIAVSNALQTALTQNGIKDVRAIHTGIDLSIWSVSEVAKNEFLKQHKLEQKKIIFFGGRLRGSKGSIQVLAAMQSIHKACPNVALLVVGGIDEYAKTLAKEAEDLGMKDAFHFTGWLERDEIKYALAASDVVLVPSVSFDSLPRTVLEGMALGKPVVGTCYGGASEVIQDGRTGYVINPRDSDEIVTKVLDLLQNKEKAEEFGKAGYLRIKEALMLEDKVKEYILLYRSLIKI